MTWLALSLITAIAVAIRDTTVKVISRDREPMEIAALELFWSLPLLAAAFFFVPRPPLDSTFWQMLLLSLPLNWLAYILYLRAISLSPLSLTVPFLAFTPVFMILTGQIVLGETATIWGVVGIVMIVGGSYVLNLPRSGEGMLAPLYALASEKGSRLMFATAAVFSLAAVVGKKGMIHSSPLYFSYLFFILFNITLLTGIALVRRIHFQSLIINRRRGIALGCLLFIHVSCHGLAIAISTAVYMVAVKRSSILFTMILCWLILKEQHMAVRGFATVLMFIGVLIITLWG